MPKETESQCSQAAGAEWEGLARGEGNKLITRVEEEVLHGGYNLQVPGGCAGDEPQTALGCLAVWESLLRGCVGRGSWGGMCVLNVSGRGLLMEAWEGVQ